MLHLDRLHQAPYHQWIGEAQEKANQGQVATRIGRLAGANPQQFHGQVAILGQPELTWGDGELRFPLMSVIKPFLLLYGLEQYGGDRLGQWVGQEPSNYPFNSQEQLLIDQGRPRNPFINSGAITLADKMPGADGSERCQQFCAWLKHLSGASFSLDQPMLDSVHAGGQEPNLGLLEILHQSSAVANPAVALDTYEQLCCLAGNVGDLAKLGLLLAQPHPEISQDYCQLVNDLMLTCGLYEHSQAVAQEIGLPMKSGISGAMVAVVPHQGAIACYGPALDIYGNSVAALTFIKRCVEGLQRQEVP